MKFWKWYVKQFKKFPFYRITKDSYIYIDDDELTDEENAAARKVEQKKAKKRARKARRFEKKWGFRYEECWNLGNTIAKFLYPRLAYLRDNHIGSPAAIQDIEEASGKIVDENYVHKKWNEVLDTLTRGFYLYATKEDYEMNEEEKELWKETKRLFVKYFECLWY